MLTVEQIVAAQKNLVGAAFVATAKSFEGVEKLAALNLQTGKAALAEAADVAQALVSVKDAQGLVALQRAAAQPDVEKLLAYGRKVADIVAATQSEIGQLAEESGAQARSAFAATFDQAIANAPAGSENAVAFVKSAVAAANGAYETLQKAVKQAAEVAEANADAVTATVTKSRSKRAA
ncbi:phasin family protein [Piscinibacter sp.]|uniref:phasin family protein n=1 Tax=Piscinibacter sp. TaxID=1903157 RepID=UPI00391FA2D5